jgi:hypothetical protein
MKGVKMRMRASHLKRSVWKKRDDAGDFDVVSTMFLRGISRWKQ